MHEGLALNLEGFGIALLGTQRVGQYPAGLSLRAAIAAGKRQRLAGAAFGLVGIALRKTLPAKLDPQQRIARLDPQRAVEGRGRADRIAARELAPGLRHERLGGRREAIFARRLRRP